jgi:hypothetical protein
LNLGFKVVFAGIGMAEDVFFCAAFGQRRCGHARMRDGSDAAIADSRMHGPVA